jgi:hypothetical protein
MPTPIYLPLESSLTTIKIKIEELDDTIETGGSPIDSYLLEMHNGLAWITLSGGGGTNPATFSLNTAIVINGLTGGRTYRFRAQAHNIHGYGL